MNLRAASGRCVRLPGDKSISARALILAACADGRSRISGLSDSEDTQSLRGALEALGAPMQFEAAGTLVVEGWGGAPRTTGVAIDLGAAAASLRFMLPLLAAGETDVVVLGIPRLFERPQTPLIEFLEAHGARITAVREAGRTGLRVRSSGLKGGCWRPPVRESSQYLSGLLLAASFSAPVRLELEGEIPSAGYVDLTLEAIRAFRGPLGVRPVGDGFEVSSAPIRACDYAVPGDPSAATFFLCALILLGGRARFEAPWSAVHPEARLMRHLFDFGLLRADEHGVVSTGCFPEEPLRFDLQQAPDAGPALAVLGTQLPAGMRLERVGRLRLKESDRIAGIQRLLSLLGHTVVEEGDDLWIPGAASALSGAGASASTASVATMAYDPDGDHRLAMAAGIASLQVPGLSVQDPDCVAKSFPAFWRELEQWQHA